MMKQYEQTMDQITITESPAVQVDNEMIRENNQGMNSVYEKLTDLQYVFSGHTLWTKRRPTGNRNHRLI